MRVGERIIEVCQILEELGPVGSGDVSALMAPTRTGQKMTCINSSKYCVRAVKMGLVSIEKSPIGNRTHYSIYTVKPDWWQLIKKREAPIPKAAAPRPRKTGIFSFASSIFTL